MTITRRTALQSLGVLTAGAAMTGTVLAVGEHEDDEREPNDVDDEEPMVETVTAVRVAHFSPDAPNVDVLVDDEQVLADVAYDDVSPYLELEPGTYRITITAAGDPDTVVFDDDVEFENAYYTVAAIGELEAETFEPLILLDAGSALLRLAHVAPDAPAVDVVTSDGEFLLYQNVGFAEYTEYIPLPAGDYSVDIFPAAAEEEPPESEANDDGENPDHENDMEEEPENDMEEEAEEPVATVELTLEPETPYTAYATGLLDPSDLEDRDFALRLTPDGPPAVEEEPVEPEPDEEVPEDEEPEPEPDEEVEEDPDDDPEPDEGPDEDVDDEENAANDEAKVTA